MIKKILILFSIAFLFGKDLSIINPTWSIIDSVNNYELIKKHKYKSYLTIIKETDKIINLQHNIDYEIYQKVFKSGLWDRMIKNLKEIYIQNHNKIIKEIIKYMEDIKKKVKEKNIAIV